MAKDLKSKFAEHTSDAIQLRSHLITNKNSQGSLMSKTVLSVEEAARLAGKSTKTIYRWISTGRVSASVDKNGHKKINLSELGRVVDLKNPNEKPVRVSQSNTEIDSTGHVKELEAKLEAMELLVKEKDLRIDELKEDKSNLQSEKIMLTHLLEDKSEKTDKPSGVISGFIKKLGL